MELRPCGRTPSQIRESCCKVGVLGRADGSAQWEAEKTVVLAAVYGPVSVGGRREQPSAAVLEVVFQSSDGSAGTADKYMEAQLHRALAGIVQTAKHPRTCIQIVVRVCKADGSVLAAALNASVAALANACVSLHSLLVASTIALDKLGNCLVDPDELEQQDADCILTAGFCTRRNLGEVDSNISGQDPHFYSATGTLTVQQLARMTQVSRAVAQQLASLFYQAIAASLEGT